MDPWLNVTIGPNVVICKGTGRVQNTKRENCPQLTDREGRGRGRKRTRERTSLLLTRRRWAHGRREQTDVYLLANNESKVHIGTDTTSSSYQRMPVDNFGKEMLTKLGW